MKEKLSAYMRRARGFTLIELLIVIAIIAILVLVAIVAINPIERIRDANDNTANSNVRQAATAIQACITKELSQSPTADLDTLCSSWAALDTNGYVSGAAPNGLSMDVDGDNDENSLICAWATGGHDIDADGAADAAYFRSDEQNVNEISETEGQAPAPVDADDCPAYN